MKLEEDNNRLNVEVRQLKKGLDNAEQKLHGETLLVQKSESEVRDDNVHHISCKYIYHRIS